MFISIMTIMMMLISNLMVVSANETLIDTEKYGLVTIDKSELPIGITPIEIKNEEELNKVMEIIAENEKILSQTNLMEDVVHGSTSHDIGIMTENEHVSSSKGITLRVYNPKTREEVWALVNFNVWANFDVWKIDVPQQTIINKENSSGVSLSGFTLGLGISDGKAFTNIASDRLSAYVHGDATLNYYFLDST